MNAIAVETTTGSSQPHAARATSALGPSLRAIWRDLVRGGFLVTATDATPDCATLWLQEREPTPRLERAAGAFDRVVGGDAQKVVAIELGLAPSTVAAGLRSVLEGMGVSHTPSRMPLAIPLLHHARARPELAAMQFAPSCPGGGSGVVIRLRRCEWAIASKLSPIEYQVAQLLLNGHCHREIADLRSTSTRTIANQVSSVYGKLRLNGRFALLRHAVEAASLSPQVVAFDTWPDARRVLFASQRPRPVRILSPAATQPKPPFERLQA